MNIHELAHSRGPTFERFLQLIRETKQVSSHALVDKIVTIYNYNGQVTIHIMDKDHNLQSFDIHPSGLKYIDPNHLFTDRIPYPAKDSDLAVLTAEQKKARRAEWKILEILGEIQK